MFSEVAVQTKFRIKMSKKILADKHIEADLGQIAT